MIWSFTRGFSQIGASRLSIRGLHHSRILLNKLPEQKPVENGTKEGKENVQERLHKILQDIPKKESIEKPEKHFEEVIKTINEDKTKKGGDSYLNTFNIKQIVDTVREGENFKELQKELKIFYDTKWKEGKAKHEILSKRLDSNIKELSKSIKIASQVVNDVTGYTKVMALRNEIADTEQDLKELRQQLIAAKEQYQDAVNLRSNSQKEINNLLERKNSWDHLDLERFTKLYMNNHDLEQAVVKASEKLNRLEEEEEQTHDVLIKSIMNRYHEEQTWSDKIRQFSTWATVLILCANVTLVLLVQLVFEPLKRWRLVSSFEDKVKDLFQGNKKLEQDLVGIKDDLKEFESKLLDQIHDTRQPGVVESLWKLLSVYFNKGMKVLSSFSDRITNFKLSEPSQTSFENGGNGNLIKTTATNAWKLLNFQLIHQTNNSIQFMKKLKLHLLCLWTPQKILDLGPADLQTLPLTALTSGVILGLLLRGI